ncbi:MAG TPA: metalloregulator ArsR/SmtB family transcription factor [Gemmatimonadaceae bacterium]
MTHRDLKDRLSAQFARIGHAVSAPKRIELLELLSQGEKTVEQLAEQSDTPVKNTSAHLRVLRQARLVETRRAGAYVHYRLADEDVFRFLRCLETLGRNRLAEVEQITHGFLASHDGVEPVGLKELRRLVREGEVTVLDVRPRDEYEAGHIPGALSAPVAELERRLRDLPKSREVIAYCRGPYCIYSFEAVALLRGKGYRARRAEHGFPDWRAEGLPIARGTDGARGRRAPTRTR